MTYTIPKLTAREKKRLREAAEKIERGEDKYSCPAIGACWPHGHFSNLRHKYASFYEQDGRDYWNGLESRSGNRKLRVLLILMFLAAGSEP